MGSTVSYTAADFKRAVRRSVGRDVRVVRLLTAMDAAYSYLEELAGRGFTDFEDFVRFHDLRVGPLKGNARHWYEVVHRIRAELARTVTRH